MHQTFDLHFLFLKKNYKPTVGNSINYEQKTFHTKHVSMNASIVLVGRGREQNGDFCVF